MEGDSDDSQFYSISSDAVVFPEKGLMVRHPMFRGRKVSVTSDTCKVLFDAFAACQPNVTPPPDDGTPSDLMVHATGGRYEYYCKQSPYSTAPEDKLARKLDERHKHLTEHFIEQVLGTYALERQLKEVMSKVPENKRSDVSTKLQNGSHWYTLLILNILQAYIEHVLNENVQKEGKWKQLDNLALIYAQGEMQEQPPHVDMQYPNWQGALMLSSNQPRTNVFTKQTTTVYNPAHPELQRYDKTFKLPCNVSTLRKASYCSNYFATVSHFNAEFDKDDDLNKLIKLELDYQKFMTWLLMLQNRLGTAMGDDAGLDPLLKEDGILDAFGCLLTPHDFILRQWKKSENETENISQGDITLFPGSIVHAGPASTGSRLVAFFSCMRAKETATPYNPNIQETRMSVLLHLIEELWCFLSESEAHMWKLYGFEFATPFVRGELRKFLLRLLLMCALTNEHTGELAKIPMTDDEDDGRANLRQLVTKIEEVAKNIKKQGQGQMKDVSLDYLLSEIPFKISELHDSYEVEHFISSTLVTENIQAAVLVVDWDHPFNEAMRTYSLDRDGRELVLRKFELDSDARVTALAESIRRLNSRLTNFPDLDVDKPPTTHFDCADIVDFSESIGVLHKAATTKPVDRDRVDECCSDIDSLLHRWRVRGKRMEKDDMGIVEVIKQLREANNAYVTEVNKHIEFLEPASIDESTPIVKLYNSFRVEFDRFKAMLLAKGYVWDQLERYLQRMKWNTTCYVLLEDLHAVHASQVPSLSAATTIVHMLPEQMRQLQQNPKHLQSCCRHGEFVREHVSAVDDSHWLLEDQEKDAPADRIQRLLVASTLFNPLKKEQLDQSERDLLAELQRAFWPAIKPDSHGLAEGFEHYSKNIQCKPRVVSQIGIVPNDLWSLKPGEWLTGESIEMCVDMITRLSADFPMITKTRVVALTSLQVAQLQSKNYTDCNQLRGPLRHLTRVKGGNLLHADTVDKILVPINRGNSHWKLGVINVRNRRLEVYDSLGADEDDVALLQKIIEGYCNDERVFKELKTGLADPESEAQVHQLREVVSACTVGWSILDSKAGDGADNIEGQENYVDCGVFTIKYAQCVALDIPLVGPPEQRPFRQADIDFFREQMLLELRLQKLMFDCYL